jgi:prepilin-type N-terminal cleavage/methylation domain-containing protein
MDKILKKNNGLTLIELLVALVLSSILIAALYRTFIGQQKTYAVQEQVVDMQQNVRVAINKMMREIRMAGFGKIRDIVDPEGEIKENINGFTQAITPGTDNITIVGGFKQIRRDNGEPISVISASGNQITLNYATDEFDKPTHRFISIGGVESNVVQSRSGLNLTLKKPLCLPHPEGTPIFKIQAITYNLNGLSLGRDENTSGQPNPQPLAENIDRLEFEYRDTNGDLTANPADIRMVRVTVTAKTSMSDPEFKGGDGYRRREISSNIQVRNMGISP